MRPSAASTGAGRLMMSKAIGEITALLSGRADEVPGIRTARTSNSAVSAIVMATVACLLTAEKFTRYPRLVWKSVR